VSDALAGVAELQVMTRPLPSPETDNGWIVKNLGASLILRGFMRRTPTQTVVEYRLFDGNQREIERGAVSHPEPFGALAQLVEDVSQSLGLDSPGAEKDRPKLDPSIQNRYLEAIGYLPGEPFERFEVQPGEIEEKAMTQVIQVLGDIVNTPEGDKAVYHAALARAYLYKHSLTNEQVWFGLAKNACDRARELDRDAHQVQVTLGYINLDLGRYAEAIDNFQRALRRRPSHLLAKLGLAGAYDLNQQSGEAERTYREAIALSPLGWLSYNELGYFYYIHGRYAEAVEQWQRVVQVVPGRDVGYTNLGNAYLNQGRLEAAVASYRQSLGVAEKMEGYAGLGTACYYEGDYDGAIEAFRKGLQLKPNDPTLLGNLGDAYRQSSNFVEAANAYDQSIGLWQSKFDTGQAYPDEIARQADSLAKRGRTSEALEKIQQALKSAPDNINCMYSAVIVYTMRGENDQALVWAKRAVESGYSATLLKLEPALASLRTSPGFNQIIQ
jgi:tetratricopeptide (TPR) repeat protein